MVAHDRGDQARLSGAFEGALAGRHLVQHAAQCPQVGARVGLFPLQLFRRHVLERADDRALGGQRRRHRRGLGHLAAAAGGRHAGRTREAEVHELRPVLREHHVPGLEITMDDSGPMCAIQGVRDLDAELEHLRHRQCTLREPLRESLPVDQLHHQIVGTVLMANVVERADVRVVEQRDGTRLALEPGAHFGRRGLVLRQHLDRHVATESRVVRAIHLAHAARAERGDDLIGAEPSAGEEHHEGVDYT